MTCSTENISSASERAAIDASARLPVLAFFISAVCWLVIGSVLGLICAWKMVYPALLDGQAWLTFGRLMPAHLNAIIYGWASLAGIGTCLWITARLCRVSVQQPAIVLIAAIFWNLGLLAGIIDILSGESSSTAWFELPGYASILLIVAFACISISTINMLRCRKQEFIPISAWYVFAAFLWFPWIYSTANILLIWQPAPGPAQPPINWWFTQSLLSLWFVPMGLASAYYFIPKILGRPVYSMALALLGFWSLAIVSVWSGMQHLIGGPVPSWMPAASGTAAMMTCLPIMAVSVNFHLTMRNHFDAIRWSPVLRFTVFGAIAYAVSGLQGILMVVPSFNTVTHFTDFTSGHAHLGIYGFFSMTIFGAMYFIMPRLTAGEWPSTRMIRWHFWLAVAGTALMFGALSLGGLLQGLALYDPDASFKTSVEFAAPFRWMSGIAGFLLLAANIIFCISFSRKLLNTSSVQVGATLLTDPDETENEEIHE